MQGIVYYTHTKSCIWKQTYCASRNYCSTL